MFVRISLCLCGFVSMLLSRQLNEVFIQNCVQQKKKTKNPEIEIFTKTSTWSETHNEYVKHTQAYKPYSLPCCALTLNLGTYWIFKLKFSHISLDVAHFISRFSKEIKRVSS